VESGGMRVGVNKTKVVVSGGRRMMWRRAAGWPCGVCSGGVGGSSLQCAGCQGWVHRRCGGMGVACRGWQGHSFAEAA